MSMVHYNPFWDFLDNDPFSYFWDDDDVLSPHRGRRNDRALTRANRSGGRQLSGLRGQRGGNGLLVPEVDLYDEPTHYTVVASVGGADPSKLHIDFNPSNNVLTLSGTVEESYKQDDKYRIIQERRSGSFQRSLTVPSQPKVDHEKITAKANNGVLTVTLPKVGEEEAPKTKKITVQTED
uniref:ARAD1D12166p n=1 Tax=Blastobotrys adeninivorans TaxID=409370 RepID=A0A060TF08_BLAAD